MVLDRWLNLWFQVFGIVAFPFGQYMFLAGREKQGYTASGCMLLPKGVFRYSEKLVRALFSPTFLRQIISY